VLLFPLRYTADPHAVGRINMITIKMKKNLPQTKYEWLILISALVYFVAYTICKSLPVYEIATGAEYPLSNWAVLFIRDLSITIAISGLIITGLRSLRENGYSIGKIMLPIIGYALCAGLIYFGYAMEKSFSEIIELSKNENGQSILREKIEKRNFKDKSDSNISRWNLLYAKDRYLTLGIKEMYLAPDGSRLQYQPTPKEEQERTEFENSQKMLVFSKKSMKGLIRNWTIVAILSSLVGLFSPIRKATKNTQPTDCTCP